MKRDMDLVRELLLRIEAINLRTGKPVPQMVPLENLIGPNEHRDSIAYHVRLLIDAGFVKGPTAFLASEIPAVTGMTWSGHDFLDSIRDPEIWRRTKEAAKEAGGSTVEILRDIAVGLIKTQIKKHTGVEL
jgi:hypothetical protein